MTGHMQAMTESALPHDGRGGTARAKNNDSGQGPEPQNQFLASVHLVILSNRALMATITVLADISTAPSAEASSRSHAYSAPAASGMAKAL